MDQSSREQQLQSTARDFEFRLSQGAGFSTNRHADHLTGYAAGGQLSTNEPNPMGVQLVSSYNTCIVHRSCIGLSFLFQ